jgi:hypothetical protein
MRKTLSVAVLVLALCSPVAAGIIHNPEPEPPPANTTQEPATTSEDTTGAADTLTQTLLAVLASLLP